MKNFLIFIFLLLCLTINAQAQNYLYSWGLNRDGQLGIGKDTWTLQQSGTDTDWESIISGEYCTLAIKTDGTLWGWGDNLYWQLGDPSIKKIYTPIQIGNSNDWVSISFGWDFTIGLKTDGSLWSWGYNDLGALGNGTKKGSYTPEKIGISNDWVSVSCSQVYQAVVAIKKDGSMWGWGKGINYESYNPIKISEKNNWAAVSYGGSATYGGSYIIAKKVEGSLWAIGNNSWGQLGTGDHAERTLFVKVDNAGTWTSVWCGDEYNIGIQTDGSLWAWGRNDFGQLGDGTTEDKSSPVQIGTDKDWKYIKCSGRETIGIKSDGSLWAWGYNFDQHFGVNYPNRILSPVRIGNSNDWKTITKCRSMYYGYTSVGIKTNGTLWGWGEIFDGNLGNGRISTEVSPKPVSKSAEWTQVSSRDNRVIAIKNDGSLWMWGVIHTNIIQEDVVDLYKNIFRKSFPFKIGEDKDWVTAATGIYHRAAIKKDGSLWAWENDSLTLEASLVPNQLTNSKDWSIVKCGDHHSLALKTDGSLWAWGDNWRGQLGDGTQETRLTPIQIGTAKDWLMISCGSAHNACIKTDGTLWTWGSNHFGQQGFSIGDYVLFPKQVDDSKDWTFVACGDSTTFAIKSDGSLWGCGQNRFGNIGDGTKKDKHGLTQIGTSNDWAYVSAGGYHIIGIKTDGTLWLWGSNLDDQLGEESEDFKTEPTQVGKLKDWVSAVCGAKYTIALKKSPLVVAPDLIFPYDISRNLKPNVKLVWLMDETEASFKIELSDKEDFSSTISNPIISDTNLVVNNLEYNKTYFWRVKAYNSSDSSEWSETWKFTTATQVGVKEIESQNLLIMPNPAGDFITLSLKPSEGFEPSEGSEIQIYNMLGEKLMIVGARHAVPLQINISALPRGIYFVKVGGEVSKFLKM